MTGQLPHFRHAGKAVCAFVRDAFRELLEMIDLPIEGMVVALSWAGLAIARTVRPRRRKQRPLQVIGAMTMVNDHVLRDVGLDRSAIGSISELSVEEIHGCRVERQVS
ncbi:MAG TPA: hypothetical protein VGA50_08190 [Kiloniellales bacterium]